jgi:fluoride ion exporter CrcB/FEX
MQRISPKLLLIVAAGGVVGVIARWQLAQMIDFDLASLLVINLSGSLLIGVAAGASTTDAIRAFFQVGFLGSFTSMSAVIVLLSPNFTSSYSLFLILITFVLAPVFASQGMKLAGALR